MLEKNFRPNYLGLSLLLSNKDQDKISEPRFGKSKNDWILLTAFDFQSSFLSDWRLNENFLN